MLILPAVDILEGRCVRLTRGDYSSTKIYAEDPVEVALAWASQGAKMIHVVDLDGAKTGKPQNIKLVLSIQKKLGIPLQVGGGIRDLKTAERLAKAGVERLVLGTNAIENPNFIKLCLDKFGGSRVVISLDARYKKLATRGWGKTINKTFIEFAKELQEIGIKYIVYTDIMRDGTLSSPNFKGVQALCQMGFHVIASGGISDLDSIEKLRQIGAYGAIVGKALYEGALTLPEALEAAKTPSRLTKRVIPCLDIKNGRVVKGVHFENLRDAGDPVELGKRYAEEGADELVFLDISASLENRQTLVDLASRVGKQVFIPFTVGGGIRSVGEIREVLYHGADKISLNTAAVLNPNLIAEASQRFGAQCIVLAMDVKKLKNKWNVFIRGGREETPLEAAAWAKQAEALGAGEILLTSMDRDGTKKGFDLELLREVTEAVNIPVIASGGAGSLEDLKRGFTEGNADAVLAASLFHYKETTIPKVKAYLREHEVSVR